MQSPAPAERTWKSVLGDHIKDEVLKKIFAKVHPRKYEDTAFPVAPGWGVVEATPLSMDHDQAVMYRLMHWALVRECFYKDIHSRILKMLFYFIEDAPLLCILEDFLPQLDEFFIEQESNLDFTPDIDISMQENIGGTEHGGVKTRLEGVETGLEAGEKGGRETCLETEKKDLKVGEKGGKEEAETGRKEVVTGKKGVRTGEEEAFAEEGEEVKGRGRDMEGSLACFDEQYVHALEIYCLLKQRLSDIRHSWRTVIREALLDHGQHTAFARSYYSSVVTTLENLVELSESVLHTLSTREDTPGAPIPKFVQLCEQLCLTEKEQDALRFIFIQNVGVLFRKLHTRFANSSSSSSIHSTLAMSLSVSTFAQLSSRETLEFFDSSRTYMKQELLLPEDEFSSLRDTGLIQMPISVLKACCGCKLSADDRYKIDKTAMGEVMSRQEAPGSDLRGLEDVSLVDEEEQTLELEEILKTCSTTEIKPSGASDPGDGKTQPYSSDLEYLEDNFQLIETLGKAFKVEDDETTLLMHNEQRKAETIVRELKAKSRSLKAKISQRMDATRKLEGWLPRLERLANLRGLDQFEKNVLLVLTGSMVSKNLRNTGHSGSAALFHHNLNIGAIISLFCDGLKEQIESRIYFYRNSRLIREGLVHISDPPLHSRGNFLDSVVELDRRLLDYIVGLDTEINELVDGSDLYTPTVSLSDVALPESHKQLLYNTFQSFDQFQKTCKDLGLSTKGTSKGICLLFYGPSGTGKTMTANAVANYLMKKILLVTVSLLLDKDLTKELLRFLFREAKIHNAILFFDECECLFESRDSRSNPNLGVLLTEIEQYSGVIILATNRHQDLDEAMHRRIQLALPFSVPDYALREEIWRSHVPSSIASLDIDWHSLALGHELTGGLICNAVLSALSLALKDCTGAAAQPILNQNTLALGAKLQLRGLLEMMDFERRVIPTFGVQDLVLGDELKKQLEMFLNGGKTQKFISAQWGFGGDENVAQSSGMVCLMCGKPGAGKTAVARAIAYELGQPIKEAHCTELLSHTFNTSRGARGVTAFFKDARKANAIVVLDGADTLLSHTTSTLLTGVVGCEHLTLMHQVEHFSGIVVLTSRRPLAQLDLTKIPKLKYMMELDIPTVKLREQLWRKLIPKKAPAASDIDHQELSERFRFTGGDIASTICQAAEQCAMQSPALLSHHLLITAAELQEKRNQQGTTIPSLFG